MITQEVIRERHSEVTLLSTCWLVDTPLRKRRCMRVGGVNGVVAETWCRLLEQKHMEVECALSTVVVNAARWSLSAMEGRTKQAVFEIKLSQCYEQLEDARISVDDNNWDVLEYVLLKEAISRVLKTLTFRERKIVKLRFGLGDEPPHTLASTGRLFNVSRERIRRVESQARKKLQHHTRACHLREFVLNAGQLDDIEEESKTEKA